MPANRGAPPSGFGLFSMCGSADLGCCFNLEDDDDDDYFSGRRTVSPSAALPGRATANSGPALVLRIAEVPEVEPSAARVGPFRAGEDVAITELQRLKTLEPLAWRYGETPGSLFPKEGSRFVTRHNFWRAKVGSADGRSECWCLLSSAESPQERHIENVQAAMDDAVAAAGHARAFNALFASLCHEEGGEHDGESVVGIRVCVPVAGFVIGGHATHVAQPGQAVSLAMYPYSQVTKFVFDGDEEYSELPQAFFHYAAWQSGGREVLADLQGFEDEEGGFLLVDPAVIRPAAVTVGDLLGTLVSTREAAREDTQDAQTMELRRFNVWHPKCGPLCKHFDPCRRSAHCRRQCGFAMPSCGVGGG